MRIIQGMLRGRLLTVPSHIRPASTRLKKSIFDVIGEEVTGASILDLFAGSGALGIEAISRGALRAHFVDMRKACAAVIRENLTALGLLVQGVVSVKDASRAIKNLSQKGESFRIVFLDPPYYQGMLKKALQTIDEYAIVAPSGYIVGLCYRNDSYPRQLVHFEMIQEKDYGQSRLLVYRRRR